MHAMSIRSLASTCERCWLGETRLVRADPMLCRSCRSSQHSLLQVRETLMTSAELRLPQSMLRHEKRARVEQIINELVR